MSSSQRIALIVGALVVAVAAFVVLRPEDETEPASQTSQPLTETQTDEQPSEPAGEETASEPEPEPKPKPQFTRIRIRGGQPVGGEAKVTVRNGEPIRLLVTSDVADEVHVHGYDLSKPVGPGQRALFVFKANLEGVFEVELEERAVPIAQLEVRP